MSNSRRPAQPPSSWARTRSGRFLVFGVAISCVAILGLIAAMLVNCGGSSQATRTDAPTGSHATSTAVLPMPLISRNVHAFSNVDCGSPASAANDASYDTTWRGCNGQDAPAMSRPVWLAYDLSSVPAAQRAQVVLAWYSGCCSYDNAISGTGAYNIPGSYTIDANAAPGGASTAPTAGWRTLVTVANNTYHSRQHRLELASYNWVRINVTVSDGAPLNYDASINMDVFDTGAGVTDDWIFYGDSITEGAMGQATQGGITSYAQLVNAAVPANFPLEENGGIAAQTTASARTYIPAQLALFGGHYVGLSYGTNDANGGCGTSACLRTFYDNFAQLVQDVIRAGKQPIVPTIPWGCTASLAANVPAFNHQIQKLYAAFPQIVKGPDLYSYFKAHKTYVSSNDCIHPNATGMGLYRKQWANAMLNAVYKVTLPAGTSRP